MCNLFTGTSNDHEQVVLAFYVLLPACSLFIFVTIHLVKGLIAWRRGETSLLNAADDRQLQRQVRKRAKNIEEELGNLERSLFWDRRQLEARRT